MNTENQCPHCGKKVAAEALRGLCPDCLLKAGFPTGDTGDPAGGQAPLFEPPAPQELATKFPQLEIIELLGRGGMGAVYKARQKHLDRVVALKILPPQVGEEPSFAARFEREAKALAKLTHPNIVTLYEFGQSDGQFYFLMEYVDGVNLSQLFQAGRLSPKEALAIVPHVCEALQYAHDQGIVHRDIKPGNILLGKNGQVKIADFGVAKIVGNPLTGPANTLSSTEGQEEGEGLGSASTEGSKVLGTPQYMSPEQIVAPGEVDHRADIYALGVVFYQMLTGELPGKPIEPPSHKVQIDVRLDAVVLRALEKKPGLRYQQVSEVKTLVETIVSTPPPASSPKTPAEPIGASLHGQTPRFSRTAIAGAAWVTLFFAVVPAFLWHEAQTHEFEHHGPFGSALMVFVFFVFIFPAFIAPFGATILGWIAVTQIRHSAGKLYGLGLAVFDGLLFPLLALNWLIVSVPIYLLRIFVEFYANPSVQNRLDVAPPVLTRIANFLDHAPAFTAVCILILLVVILVDWLIIRRVWRAVNHARHAEPQAQAVSTAASTPNSKPPRVNFAVVIAGLAATIAILVWVVSALAEPVSSRSQRMLGNLDEKTQSIEQQVGIIRQAIHLDPRNLDARRWLARKLTEQKEYRSAADEWRRIGTMDASNFGRRAVGMEGICHWLAGEPTQAAGFLEEAVRREPALVTARVFLAATYADLGLREKAAVELVMLDRLSARWRKEFESQPDLRDERQAALAKLASFAEASQARLAFGPVIERVLPSGMPCRELYFQFRSGEIFIVGNGPGTSREEAAYDEQKLEDAGGADMSVGSLEAGVQIVGRGCFFTRDVDELKWGSLTAEEAVEAVKHVSFVEGVVSPKKSEFPITYLFKTARGEVGLMEVLGMADHQSEGWTEEGMKFRYKLVQGTGTPPPAAPKRSSLSFGPESRGLQAALEVIPGEPFQLRLHLRNVSTRGILIEGADYRQDDECLLADAQGRPVPVKKVTHDIKVAMKSGFFSSGQVAVFESAGLSFQTGGKVWPSAGYLAPAQPGRYTLRFRLRLPGSDAPFATETNAWQGELETGPVTIEVKDPATQRIAPVADHPLSAILGPPVERTVNDLQTTHENCALSLDTGQLLSVPATITFENMTNPPTEAAALAWAREHQVDAFAFVTVNGNKVVKCGLLCPALLVLRATSKKWDPNTAEPQMLKEDFEKAMHSWNFIPQIADVTTDGDFPANYLVLDTRTHRRGVLQILGVADHPRGVKIRYRLVEGAPVKQTAP